MIEIKVMKERITTKEVLEFYGVSFNSKGFAPCPFHPERTPSFHYNQKKDSWHCFSCGKGGDMFDFVAEYFHFSLPTDLPKILQKIDQDLRLGLDQSLSPDEQKQLQTQREEDKKIQKAKEQWEASLKDNYDRWGMVFRKVFRTFGEREANNPEFQELIDRFEDAFADGSGNTFRSWPPADLSRQQKRWMLLAVQGPMKESQPNFSAFLDSHMAEMSARLQQMTGHSLECRTK